MTATRRAHRRRGEYITGVGSLLAIVGVVAGTPTLLIALDARFWPDHLPTWTEVWDRLTSPDDGTILLGALAATAWTGWVVLTVIIAAEIIGHIRGWSVPHVPGLAGPHHLAAALVAATTVLLTTPPTPMAPATAHRHPTPTLAHHLDPDHPQTQPQPQEPSTHDIPAQARPTPLQTAEHHSNAVRPDLPSYTVARHDTLWGIAEVHLGGGTRWRDILALNPQLHDPDHLHPGQNLLLPADATTPRPPTRAGDGTTRLITVHAGDTLWDLAATHLGDPHAWPALYHANTGRAQPDGHTLTSPDLIHPGWQLTLPEPPTTTPPPATAPAPPTPTPGSPTNPSPPTPKPAPPGSDGEEPANPNDHGDNKDDDEDQSEEPGGAVPLPGGGWLALSVAGAIATALAVTRLRQRNHIAASGTAIPRSNDTEPSPAIGDDEHPSGPEPDVASSLDQAWRSAVARAAAADWDEHDQPETAPAHAAIGVLAQVTGPSGIPIGPARPVPPPLGSITAGWYPDGREATVSLAELEGWGLTGPGAPGVARALVLTLLATGQDTTELILTPHAAHELLGDEAQALHRVPGVQIMISSEAALASTEHAIMSRTRLLEQTSTAEELPDYRRNPVLGQIPTTVLVTEAPTSDPYTRRLRTACALGREYDVTALVLGTWPPGTTTHLDHDGTITTSTAEPGSSLCEGGRLATATSHDTVRLITDVLGDTRGALDQLTPQPHASEETGESPLHEEEPSTEPLDGRPEPEGEPQDADVTHHNRRVTVPEWTADSDAPLAIAILGGTLRLYTRLHPTDSARAPIDSHHLRSKVTEVAAYLACHPDGATTNALLQAIWPETDRRKTRGSLHTTISELRRTLVQRTAPTASPAGRSVDSQPHPPELVTHTDSGYRLNPQQVDVDHWQLQMALNATASNDEQERLTALEQVAHLHTGELLDGAPYPWVEPLRHALRTQVGAALTTLANHHATTGDPTTAAKVAEQVIDIEPHVEEHYRHAMRLHAELGHHDAIRRLHRLLETRLADLDADPSEETTRLIAYLQRHLHQSGSHTDGLRRRPA